MSNNLKIFLVDKNLECLGSCLTHLSTLGFEEVNVFLNPAICLNNLDKKPEIIVIHIPIEDINNFDFIKKIKKLSPETFILVIINQIDPEASLNLLSNGVFDVFTYDQNIISRVEQTMFKIEQIMAETGKDTKIKRKPKNRL